jgi:L-asparaginase / beta-aspartyl-peptidase
MKARVWIIGILPIVASAALYVTAGAAVPRQPYQQSSARSEIESILKMQQKAWNRGDVEDFLQGYWHSPDLTFSGSNGMLRGWDSLLQRYKKAYPNRAAMGHLTFSDLEFRELGPQAYLVLGKWHLDRASGAIGGVFTLIFRKFPEGWRIIHDHTSLVSVATK